MPTFFVPDASDDQAEETYEALAAFAGRTPLPVERRIYQIVWMHDGEEWTATVGATLRGTFTKTRTVRGARREVTERLSSSARVLAIFPGQPYFVVTDAQPIGPRPSNWANPLMAGRPSDVRHFDTPPADE